jgi:hypothetical protein
MLPGAKASRRLEIFVSGVTYVHLEEGPSFLVIFYPPQATYPELGTADIVFFRSESAAQGYVRRHSREFLRPQGAKADEYSERTRNVVVSWTRSNIPAIWRTILLGCLKMRS